ncbi:hypothetical protein POX_a01228 [Penicillium oxalicum]|uniref:hypothetical protein n=1 Tax=Penicillium oxalicum TaxID=69781 RepID=UPI0020B83F82|nr:hypothetical protein POX_a01228 [Penicillium oxalicum]KAI2794629.1 hypothetical protein POX_a01228 [Penicillium oxalicum]
MVSSAEHENNGGWKVFFKRISNKNQASESKTGDAKVTELQVDELEGELPQLSSETTERVFPVRSLVSVDSASSSILPTPSLDSLETNVSPFSEAFKRSALVNDDGSKSGSQDGCKYQQAARPTYLTQMHEQKQRLAGISSSSGVPTINSSALPGSRLQPPSNSEYDPSDISPRDGGIYERLHYSIKEGAKILRPTRLSKGLQFSTEDEAPIFVQPFGALIVVSQSGDHFPVEVTSSNTEQVLSIKPDDLIELKSFSEILSESQASTFRTHAEYVLRDEYEVDDVGPEVFCLLSSNGTSRRLWCTMHTSKAYKNYVICELEWDNPDSQQLKVKFDSENSHHQRANSLGRFVYDRAFDRALRSSARESSPHEAICMELKILNDLPHILRNISSAQSIDVLVTRSVESVKSLFEFHRITVYHFNETRGGVVLADAVGETQNLESYQGMHFQESSFSDDLKRQYLRNRVAFSYRKSNSVAELVYRASVTKIVLDLSHCYLTISPDVSESDFREELPSACLSVNLRVFGKCWGLISCQSFDGNQRLHPLLQRVSWLLSDAVSSNIERLSYTSVFQAHGEPSKEASTGGRIEKRVIAPTGDLLGTFGADHAAAYLLGKVQVLGKPSDSQKLMALGEYFREKKFDTILWSTNLTRDFSELNYSPGFHDLASLLYIPLSESGSDFIILVRVRYQFDRDTSWKDSESQSLAWSPEEYAKASMLALFYRTFKKAWHEDEVATQNDQLMKLLLANTAHEFRTPLNAIINYLEIALDSSLNQETRENLSRSHSASKSLVYIINDLLDLTNAEDGNHLIKDEIFSLSDTIHEATNIFWEEAKQMNVTLQVMQHTDLPPVLGDQRRVRQVMTNLISNAVRHTSSGAVTVESCIVPELCQVGQISLEVAIHDTGDGMSQETVESLFCELEQVVTKAPTTKSNQSQGNPCKSKSADTGSVLGLGLALVARLVSNMNGQLSLKSEEGTGSCFRLRLKFPLPTETANQDQTRPHSNCGNSKSTWRNGTDGSLLRTSKGQEHGIPCHCGDNDFFGSGSKVNENDSLDVEISLTNGESRSISLAAPLLKQEKRMNPTEGLFSASEQEKEEKARAPIKQPKAPTSEFETPSSERGQEAKLRILVAEDDPVNRHILKGRLGRLGYDIRLTANGKECAAAYGQSPDSYDAILMDLQMPVVDGLSAAKIIRYQEIQAASEGDKVPIFVISASLAEKDRPAYIEAGFDGWVTKPIDFQRVDKLLDGVTSSERRDQCLYRPGLWEHGGWF